MKIAGSRKEHKPHLRWTHLLASTQPLEASPGLLVQLPRQAVGSCLAVGGRLEIAEEGLGGELLHLEAGGRSDRRVARHQDDPVAAAMLGGEPLQQRVRVRGVAHGERPALGVLAGPVEDDDAAVTNRVLYQLSYSGAPTW